MKNYNLILLVLALNLLVNCGSKDSISEEMNSSEVIQFVLNVSSSSGGSVSTTGGSYDSGTQISLTAIPDNEYVFNGWSNGSIDNPITVILNQNITLIANFIKRKYPLTINIQGEGIVTEEIVSSGKSSPTEYNSGSVVRLTAIPSDCWEFDRWTGDFESNVNPIEIEISSSRNINLSFLEKPIREINQFASTSYLNRTYYNRSFNNYLENGDPLDAVVLDYNMDGFLDIVHTDSNYGESFNGVGVRNYIKFFIGDCNGELTLDEELSYEFNGLIHGRKGLVGDYNNDNYPDIFFVGHGIDANDFPGEYPILLLNNGGSGFIENRFENLIGFFHTATSGDYDNDGDQDIVLISQGVTYILVNDGIGSFTIIKDDINYDTRSIVEFQRESIVPSMRQIYTSELFDVDSDGFLDLIVTGHDFPDQYSGESAVLYGNGESFLSGYKTLPSPLGFGIGVDIDFYDINSDGNYEIILNRTGDPINGLGFYTGWKLQILELVDNNYVDSTEKFIDVSSGIDSSWMYWIHIDDYDNDGVVELFNDDLKTELETSIRPYKVWDLIDGRFILQTYE